MKMCRAGLHSYEGYRCQECRRIRQRRADKKIYLNKTKAYRQTPEGHAKHVIYSSRYAAKKYGHTPITSSYEDVMEVMSAHRCAFCGKEETGRRFGIDHDHKTGKVRGLLCPRHNTMLRDLDEMKAIIAWVEALQ